MLYLVSINHMINDGSVYLIATLFPLLVSVFRFQNFEVGIMVAAGYIVNMIFQPIAGRYSETFEARKLLALGISIIGGSMLLFTFASTFSLMLITVVILRVGSSFFHPVGVSAISKTYLGSSLDRAMGFQSAFGNLGVLVVFVISSPIYSVFQWKGPFLVFAIFDIFTVVLTLSFMKSRKSIEHRVATQEKPRDERTTFKLSLPLFFILTMTISGGVYAVFANYGNLLLSETFSLNVSNYLMATWVVAAFFGAMITGPITKRIKRRILLLISYVAACVSTLFFFSFASNELMAVLGLVANGFFLSASYPLVYSELASYLESSSRPKGTSFGILFSSQIIGSSIMGLFGGWVSSSLGWSFPFVVSSALLVFAFVVTFLWKAMPVHSVNSVPSI